MKTVEDFFNQSHRHPFYTDRINKIEQLKKPVYSKKIKQPKHRPEFLRTDFVTMNLMKNLSKADHPESQSIKEQKKMRKSKSDLFFKKLKDPQNDQQSRIKIDLANNLIIEKVQLNRDKQKQRAKSSKQKNIYNIIKRITGNLCGSSLAKVQTHEQNNLQRKQTPIKLHSENNSPHSPLLQPKKTPKQNVKIIQFINKQQLQSNIINELGQLRKRRNTLNHCQQDKKQPNKIVPKNGLFFKNYLKHKQKSSSDKSPHINFVKSATQVIKIQQNPDLQKTLTQRENAKNILRNRLSFEKLQKISTTFNSMKIQPW